MVVRKEGARRISKAVPPGLTAWAVAGEEERAREDSGWGRSNWDAVTLKCDGGDWEGGR